MLDMRPVPAVLAMNNKSENAPDFDSSWENSSYFMTTHLIKKGAC